MNSPHAEFDALFGVAMHSNHALRRPGHPSSRQQLAGPVTGNHEIRRSTLVHLPTESGRWEACVRFLPIDCRVFM